MPDVCFYFQVHQPFRIKRFSYFDRTDSGDYFDDDANGGICRKVTRQCYLPMNGLLEELIARYPNDFKVAFSITGTALEQFELYAPETLESFQRLAKTGNVEFIGETYYHSLSALYDEAEFAEQVRLHGEAMRRYFGAEPRIFRNTELIYSNDIGRLVAGLGFEAMIAEGADDILGWRSPDYLYTAPGTNMKLLLKNYRLSDDIAFRFGNRGWSEYPLTADKFASWLHARCGTADTINLFMDYETFGEHQWADTGIFEFMRHLPEAVRRHPDVGFAMPSEVAARYPSRAELEFGRLTSWADTERDVSAWRGNSMQRKALDDIYAFGPIVKELDDPELVRTWRKLLTSDHFYYMSTKALEDGDVHAYFSPYESPYDAYIYYRNVLRNFSALVADRAQESGSDSSALASRLASAMDGVAV